MNMIFTPLDQRSHPIFSASYSVKELNTGMWIPDNFPVFDMIEEIEPTVIFIDLKYISSTFIEALKEHPEIKIVLFGQGVPRDIKPSALIAMPNTSKSLRHNIESEEYETLYLNDSANVVEIFNGKLNENMLCDVGCVFNSKDPESYIDQMLLLTSISHTCNLKIVGTDRIGIPQYLGTILAQEISQVYKSSKIIFDYGGAQILDIAANGGFAISTVSNKLYPEVDRTRVSEQFKELSDDKKRKTRNKIARVAQQKVLSSDTCYHRLESILSAIKLEEQAKLIREKLEEKILCVLEYQ